MRLGTRVQRERRTLFVALAVALAASPLASACDSTDGPLAHDEETFCRVLYEESQRLDEKLRDDDEAATSADLAASLTRTGARLAVLALTHAPTELQRPLATILRFYTSLNRSVRGVGAEALPLELIMRYLGDEELRTASEQLANWMEPRCPL